MKNSTFFRIRKAPKGAPTNANAFCSLDSHARKLVLMDNLVSRQVIERYFQKDTDISKHSDGLLASSCIFKADGVFGQETNNSLLYEESIKPLVTSFVSGKNATCFLVGGTASGKKFTIFGDEVKEKGLLAYTFDEASRPISLSLKVGCLFNV
jgi:Kinesin motor domain